MSAPQHIGDLIFLSESSGHLETCTDEPSGFSMMPLTKGLLQLPHDALTDIPHVTHSYVAMVYLPFKDFWNLVYANSNSCQIDCVKPWINRPNDSTSLCIWRQRSACSSEEVSGNRPLTLITQRDTSGSLKSGFEPLENGHKFIEENIKDSC